MQNKILSGHENYIQKPDPAHLNDKRELESKFNVSLVRGPIVFEDGAVNNEATPAIGFAYIAGYLKHFGYNVEIIDAIGEGLNQISPLPKYPGFFIQGLNSDELIARIQETSGVIGFSAMFSGEWPVLRDLISLVRAKFPKALLVAGGEHASALPEYCLKDCPSLDIVIRGEGERKFYKLLEAKKANEPIETVSGICYLNDEGRFIETLGAERVRDLSTIPWPYWPDGYLEKFWEAGKSHGVLTKRDMPMLASRGCPYQCTFCSNSRMWTTRYVLRDVDDVLDEIDYYIKKYDITSIQFYDLTAITKKRWIIEFCKKLISRNYNIFWSLPAGTRSEVLDLEVLRLANESGCHYLVYAPESGSLETLELIKKRIILSNIVESMCVAKQCGLVLRANLVIGFPHETRLNMYKTLIFGLRLTWLGIDEVALFIFSAYPGTEIFEELQADKCISIDDKFFLGLTSLNGKFFGIRPKVYNKNMQPAEISLYRLSFMLIYYFVGYMRYPSRIIRTARNIFSSNSAATVFEHRLRDLFKRLNLRKGT